MSGEKAMNRNFVYWKIVLGLILLGLSGTLQAYQNFKVAVYCTRFDVEKLADETYFQNSLSALSKFITIDKVYLEVHRRTPVDSEILKKVKERFAERGIRTAGGITATKERGNSRHFKVLCYSDARDVELLLNAMETAARIFDECILDDVFFTDCRCPGCIEAKGTQSWSSFRLKKMSEISQLLVERARAINPKIKMVIKYPNWYEFYQETGYNLQTQPKIFDGIYTGTETRHPVYTHQNLQPYQSYSIVRFLENVAAGKNGGGWVDPLDRGTMDRYADQLYLTLFAGAGEITLFHWDGLFDKKLKGRFVSSLAAVAGSVFETADQILPALKNPRALTVYKPLHSRGENFLPSYLGMIGVPVEITPELPQTVDAVLLTANAAGDTGIVPKIQEMLLNGTKVILTSGLLEKLKDKGIRQIINAGMNGPVVIDRCSDLNFKDVYRTRRDILLPGLILPTNDAWREVLGITPGGSSVPLLSYAAYGTGEIWLLTVPFDFAQFYDLPRQTLWQIRQFLLEDQKVILDAPANVAFFNFNDQTLLVYSFKSHAAKVGLVFKQKTKVIDFFSGREMTLKTTDKGHVVEWTLPAGQFKVLQLR